MQRFIFAGVVLLIFATQLRAAEGFLATLKPDDFAAAGLDRLSVEQRAKLAALVEAYRNSSLTAEATRAAGTEQATESRPANLVNGRQATDAKSSNERPGMSSKTKVGLMPGTEVEYSTIKSSIPGSFSGWEAHTVFTLANGQRWQVANGGNYFTPTKENVEVEIVPARLGGYWMIFPVFDTRVRVKLLPGK